MRSELLEGKTGVLDIVLPGDRQTITWNGEGSAEAKAVFERYMERGSILASVLIGPGKSDQVKQWSEVEQREAEVGTVAVMITPQIAGG